MISRRGGAIVAGIRLTWPLARLTVTPESLRLDTLFGGHYALGREEVALRRTWRQLWPAVQIEHARADLPRDLAFLPFHRPALVRELERLGYAVA